MGHGGGLHGGGPQIWSLYGEEQHVLRGRGDVGQDVGGHGEEQHVLRERGDEGQDVGGHGGVQDGGEQDGGGQDGGGRGVHIREQDEGHDKHQVFQDE